jgi:hypothetical protein
MTQRASFFLAGALIRQNLGRRSLKESTASYGV